MADTALPRSDLPAGEQSKAALAAFLARASGAQNCHITGLSALSGGSIQENWGLDVEFAGGTLDGAQRLVLRASAATGVPSSLDRLQEFAVLRAAFAAGVTVPEPLFACSDPAVFGKSFFVMRRASGSAAAHRITRDPALELLLSAIAERLGRELARIHTIRPPRADLEFLRSYESSGPQQQIAGFREYLDRHPAPRPVLEWGIRWLETRAPPRVEPVLCHHDFRTGNYLLDGAEMTGILDWEFAGWGDPHEDIGWFCSMGWRFARIDREAGGIADRAPFYHGYESASGRSIDPVRAFYWEVLASVRWAVIALQQSERFIAGGERSLDLALTGRRADECEFALLMLLDREGAPPSSAAEERCSPPEEALAIADLPPIPALLAAAGDLLIAELLPLLPAERRLEARLVANCMAIAEREIAVDGAAMAAIIAEIRNLIEHPPTSRQENVQLAPCEGELPPSRRGRDAAMLRRFAREMRIAGFENSPQRAAQARAILWRMTIARLRLANPRFLAANGFS